MSTQYNGDAANIVEPTSVNISSSTNANPIVITTTAAHNRTTGDYVDITNHQTNTNANGIWRVTVITPTTFSIPAAGNGVGGTTGAVQALAQGATAATPSDGDDESAASVDTPIDTLFDRTAATAKNTGAYKLVSLSRLGADVGVSGAWAVLATSDTTFHVIPDNAGPVSLPWFVAGVVQGDLVEVTVTTSAAVLAGAADYYMLALAYAIVAPGGSPSFVKLPKSGVLQPTPYSAGTPLANPITLTGVIQAAGTGFFYLQPGAQCSSSTAHVASLVGDVDVVVKIWRPTNRPQ